MELTFTNPGMDYMIKQIMEFQTKDQSSWKQSKAQKC